MSILKLINKVMLMLLSDICKFDRWLSKLFHFFIHVLQSNVRITNILIKRHWAKRDIHTTYIFIVSIQMFLKSTHLQRSSSPCPCWEEYGYISTSAYWADIAAATVPSGTDKHINTPCLPPWGFHSLVDRQTRFNIIYYKICWEAPVYSSADEQARKSDSGRPMH